MRINRRTAVKGIAATALAVPSLHAMKTEDKVDNIQRVAVHGNINHSVSKWCYTNGKNGYEYT